MKDSIWFWVLGVVLLVVMLKGKATKTTGTSGAAGTLPNANTATDAPAPWLNLLGLNNLASQGKASTIGQEVSTGAAGLSSIFGLFGGSSKATGTPSPSTSGSGTGVVNNSQAGDNSGAGSSDSSTDSNTMLDQTGGFDTWGINDFGAS